MLSLKLVSGTEGSKEQNAYFLRAFRKFASPDGEALYNNPRFEQLLIQTAEIHLPNLPEIEITNIGNDEYERDPNIQLVEEAKKLAKNITRYSDVYFLTAYDDDIKDVKNIDKFEFMWSCDRRGKIENSTITSSKYQHQIFENDVNYVMDYDSFIYVFSAYTIAFNANTKPERYLTKQGSFVSRLEAEKIYKGDNKQDAKSAKESNQDIIEYLFNKFLRVVDKNVEYTTRSGKEYKLSTALPFKAKRAIIGNEIFHSGQGFNFEDADTVHLTWKKEWAQRNYRLAGWRTLMKMLSRDKTYKQYYYGEEQ